MVATKVLREGGFMLSNAHPKEGPIPFTPDRVINPPNDVSFDYWDQNEEPDPAYLEGYEIWLGRADQAKAIEDIAAKSDITVYTYRGDVFYEDGEWKCEEKDNYYTLFIRDWRHMSDLHVFMRYAYKEWCIMRDVRRYQSNTGKDITHEEVTNLYAYFCLESVIYQTEEFKQFISQVGPNRR